MSTVVTDIYAALKSQVSTTLGATFHELPRKYSPGEGDFRGIHKAYAVVQGGSTQNPILDNKCYMLDQTFEILLTDRAVERHGNDDDQSDAINNLYDKAHDIFQDVIRTNLGVDEIAGVSEPRFDAPEFFENGLVLIRAGLTIKYAQALS